MADIPKAMSRLRVLQEQVDEHTAGKLEGSQPSCKTGCAHCCYHLVPATMPETLAALLEAVRNGHKKLVTRYTKVRKDYNKLRQIGWDEARWFKLKRPCLFLTSNNRCAAYVARPMACRTYVAFSPADACKAGGSVEVSDAVATYGELVDEDIAELARDLGVTHKKAPMQAWLPQAIKMLGAES